MDDVQASEIRFPDFQPDLADVSAHHVLVAAQARPFRGVELPASCRPLRLPATSAVGLSLAMDRRQKKLRRNDERIFFTELADEIVQEQLVVPGQALERQADLAAFMVRAGPVAKLGHQLETGVRAFDPD